MNKKLSQQLAEVKKELACIASAQECSGACVFNLGRVSNMIDGMIIEAKEQEQALEAASTLIFMKKPDMLDSIVDTLSSIFASNEELCSRETSKGCTNTKCPHYKEEKK